MAEDPYHDITWFLEIDQQHLDYLGPIRHWAELKIAAEPGTYWIKGLSPEQLDSVEIKSIPFKRIFYAKGHLLFPHGGAVPVRKLPTSLLWTPLERGLSLNLPSFNHNYFGIRERVRPRLVPSKREEPAAALLTTIALLESYILSAPSIRLKPLSWVMIDDQALILGKPLLPLPGDTWWEKDDFLIPAGLDWEWAVLAETLNRELNGDSVCWLLWDANANYVPIGKEQFRPLSISSFRRSITGSSTS